MNNILSLDILRNKNVKFAFYFKNQFEEPVSFSNETIFHSASIIKVPILLSWLELEKIGAVNREAICDLDGENQVEGAGFSTLLHSRHLTYHDVLLMMIATSDNLCTNLVIKEIGIERLQRVMNEKLTLKNTRCERKLMDYAARDRGLDNRIDSLEFIQLYSYIDNLEKRDQAWIKSLLAANTDDALLKRNITRDSLTFYHKTGSITGVLHDWGFTDSCEIFLFTENVQDEPAVFEVFGKLGQQFLTT